MSDFDYDSMTNNLCDSVNGTFVTLDDSSHFTVFVGAGELCSNVFTALNANLVNAIS